MRGKLYFTAIVAGAAALAGLFVLVAAVTTFSGKAAAAGDGDIVLLVNNAYRQARRLTSASRTKETRHTFTTLSGRRAT